MAERTVYDIQMSIKDIDYDKRTMSSEITYKDAPLDATMHKVVASHENLTNAQVKKLKYMQKGKLPSIAGGAALGAIIGNKITNDDTGAVVGAGVGGVAGAAIHTSLNSKYNLEIAESIIKKATKAL